MNSLNPGGLDCIKHSLAEIDSLAGRAKRMLSSVSEADAATARLAKTAEGLMDAVRATVDQAAAAFVTGGDNPNRYFDGRPVRTHLSLGADDHVTYVWHPQPDHPANQPHHIATVTTSGGNSKHVFVAAPGVLDSVDASPTITRDGTSTP